MGYYLTIEKLCKVCKCNKHRGLLLTGLDSTLVILHMFSFSIQLIFTSQIIGNLSLICMGFVCILEFIYTHIYAKLNLYVFYASLQNIRVSCRYMALKYAIEMFSSILGI